VLPQALQGASRPDLWAGWQALRGESELPLAQPGRQVSWPTAGPSEPRQAVLAQPAQLPERPPLERPASQSASLARRVSPQAQRSLLAARQAQQVSFSRPLQRHPSLPCPL